VIDIQGRTQRPNGAGLGAAPSAPSATTASTHTGRFGGSSRASSALALAGAAQATHREPDLGPDPLSAMAEVGSRALEDAGGVRPRDLTHLVVVHCLSLRHAAPAEELRDRLGASGAEARTTGMGGSVPQWVANRLAERAARGEPVVALLVGAEALATVRRARREGRTLAWPTRPGQMETWPPIEPDLGIHPVERANGLEDAIRMYALVESAIAHARGRPLDAHLRAIGELMARLERVAAKNPIAWFGRGYEPAALIEPSPDNRLVASPYTKRLCAVLDVDMAAAVVLVDEASARRLGLEPSALAWLAGFADGTEAWHLATRPAFWRAEALSDAVRRASRAAGLGIDEIDAFDLYACFPSALEAALEALGVEPDDQRPITLTGGLPAHGGPGSNYVTHALANAYRALTEGVHDTVLVQGNGFYLTKHAVGIWALRPPAQPPAFESESSKPAAAPLELVAKPSGRARVLAGTVPYRRDGSPEPGIVLLELSDGRRSVARTDDELTTLVAAGEAIGTEVVVEPAEGANRAALLSPVDRAGS
jgi:acetyl-CoA C-acetyltransferase